MGTEALDLNLCSFDHRFEIGDQSVVDPIVCGTESVERSRAGSVENSEHGELLGRGHVDGPAVPEKAAPLTPAIA